ncbi:hypothetical protein [Egbenema bharatensis]|jgi:predicted DNA-binding protein|uniref:hypothetical protein n=1 Tax=Egbenema bharatensis TaxID=3463334 RepID=UPI003A850D76
MSEQKEEIIRFTVDLNESLHRDLSFLAVRCRRSKADLVRQAIVQLLKDMEDEQMVR